jgi:hypothetical protein
MRRRAAPGLWSLRLYDTHSLGRELTRQCELLCERRLSSMEGGIEAGNLWDLGRNGTTARIAATWCGW